MKNYIFTHKENMLMIRLTQMGISQSNGMFYPGPLMDMYFVGLVIQKSKKELNVQAVVTMNNFQRYRHITSPGWSLGWTWAKREVIWSMMGGQTTEQGDCSKFKGNIPHSCKKNPTVVDLLPGTPYNQQIANCCKGGVLSSWVQDPSRAAASFQVSVGDAGNSKRTVKLPTNFTLKTPGPGYTCGKARIVRPTKFITPDKRRTTQALSTPHLASFVSGFGENNLSPMVQCSNHMCPIRVHWHVKFSSEKYWHVKVMITNFNYRMKYSDWNLAIQHPNFDHRTQVSGFNYKLITPYASINDTAELWGMKSQHNDVLNLAGPNGKVQGDILFRKDKASLSFDKGWAFPRRIYFNGDITFLASTMQQVNHQSCTIPRNANDKKEDSTRGGSDGIITIIEKMEKQNEKMMEESQRMQEL
uniref:Phytochelatin synthetase-like protein n=1 Tax=Phaseolus vulgaris TaxID=3885 RepID=Q69F99_PHAVU|nr:phytochelatin synthetase-like protein [Phaseolus vulgaris]